MRLWPIASVVVVGVSCGRTTETTSPNAAAATGVAGATGSAGSAARAVDSGTTTLTGTGVGGTGPTCAFPDDLACSGECFDPRSSDDNCGNCGHACPEGERCSFARCEGVPSCRQTSIEYGVEQLSPTGGVALDDGWALVTGDTLTIEHELQPGPVVFHLVARALEDELRSSVALKIDGETVGPLLLRSTSYATYSLEYDSPGGVTTIGIETPPDASGAPRVAEVRSLEIEECRRLHGLCAGGGYYLPDVRACVPPVCSEPADCTRDFAGEAFHGQCIDGACRYPSCEQTTDTGRALFEELTMGDGVEVRVSCFSYERLLHPHNNPRAMEIDGSPADFACPDVEALTWEISPFRGEGSCVQVPVCGPNAPDRLPGSTAGSPCCYLVSWMCGV